jgi:hypothetical protein
VSGQSGQSGQSCQFGHFERVAGESSLDGGKGVVGGSVGAVIAGRTEI